MVLVVPSLLGPIRVPCMRSATFLGMSVDAVGYYRIRFVANNLSVVSDAFRTTWSPASNLHIMNDVSAGSYLTPLSVARRFGLTVVVSDYYGNIVLSHRPSVNISLVEDASPAVALLDRVIGRRHT